MLPRDLKPEQFAAYPPEASKLVVAHLDALRQLPLSFVPSLLREAIEYDFKFPTERTAIAKELAAISSLTPAQRNERFRAFSRLSLSVKLEHLDWINQPGQFVEQLSAYLWTTHQQDAFRAAALAYEDLTEKIAAPHPIAMRRLGIAVIGQGVASYDRPLFRNLRKYGTYFRNVKPDRGVELLLSAVEARAEAHPVRYGHWYVDGGEAADHSPLLSCVSFERLAPVRAALLRDIQTEIAKPGMGPEELRTYMVRLSPADLGMDKSGDEVLQRFQVKLFTEGSGTQIFSTTFAQWAAREALRRAEPLTLLMRVAPRQRQRSMNELLSSNNGPPELDVTGSLIDADMGAYYQWINQQRLAGSEHSSFLVWFEGHNQALAIGPSLPRGTESNSNLNLKDLLSLAVG
ncbi:MAG: hypothetical protein M3Y50_14085 [Acidobacteriota bacterium]|nr:hypothetical protein [Acidobacteriota bacterium]